MAGGPNTLREAPESPEEAGVRSSEPTPTPRGPRSERVRRDDLAAGLGGDGPPGAARLTLSLMNLTEPSRNPTFTPPEWFELAPIMVPSSLPGIGPQQPVSFE